MAKWENWAIVRCSQMQGKLSARRIILKGILYKKQIAAIKEQYTGCLWKTGLSHDAIIPGFFFLNQPSEAEI